MEKEDVEALEKINKELAAMEERLINLEVEPEAAVPAPAPDAAPVAEQVNDVDTAKFPPDIVPAADVDVIAQEAIKIRKEILNYVFTIEQYIRNVSLEGSILKEAQQLVAKAHVEVEKDKPKGLGKLHKELADMTARLDDLAGRTLGLPPPKAEFKDIEAVIEAGKEAESKTKDDTKPFKIIK
jgi:hypothetical protein